MDHSSPGFDDSRSLSPYRTNLRAMLGVNPETAFDTFLLCSSAHLVSRSWTLRKIGTSACFPTCPLLKLQRSLASQSKLRSLPRLSLKVNVFLQHRTLPRDRSSALPRERMDDPVLYLLCSRSSSSLGFSVLSSDSCDRHNLGSQISRSDSWR
jgi:hypothetical protein